MPAPSYPAADPPDPASPIGSRRRVPASSGRQIDRASPPALVSRGHPDTSTRLGDVEGPPGREFNVESPRCAATACQCGSSLRSATRTRRLVSRPLEEQ